MKDQGKSGQITVFFAICLLSVCALLLGLFESARTAGARLYFTQAADSAVESLFSQYHRELWEDYRLLGLEHYSDEQLEEEFKSFMEPYFKVKDWYPMELSEAPSVTEKVKLTDNEGEIYEKQVLEYMKYGLLEELWDIDTAEGMLTDMAEALELKEIKTLYEGHSKEAAELEKAIEKLNEKLEEQRESYEASIAAVEALNGRRLIKEMKELIKRLNKVPPLVETYKKKAEELSKKLKASREEFERGKGDLSDSVKNEMEANISEYEAYVNKDGERRKEIEGLTARAEENIIFAEMIIEVAEEVLDYIASWEPCDEDDELDEEALWRPVESKLKSYDLLYLNINFGVADKEKEGFLESVGNLLKGNLLELVLPPGADISKEKLPLSAPPSETCFSGHNGCRAGLLKRVSLTEYTLKEFHYYGRDKYGEKPETKGGGRLEAEYILYGRDNDYENLSETVSELVFIREGLNLIYLFSDSAKRNEAKALAAAITGVLGFPPLISVMTFFILGIWALGQALCDVRELLAGGRVPLIHNDSSWTLGLEGLLEIGRTKSVAASAQGAGSASEKGLSYKDWLRVLIFKDMGTLTDYRSMDMIQMNLRSSQPDFLLNRCAVSAGLRARARTKHVLFSLGLLNKGGRDKSYSISTETFYTYQPE